MRPKGHGFDSRMSQISVIVFVHGLKVCGTSVVSSFHYKKETLKLELDQRM